MGPDSQPRRAEPVGSLVPDGLAEPNPFHASTNPSVITAELGRVDSACATLWQALDRRSQNGFIALIAELSLRVVRFQRKRG